MDYSNAPDRYAKLAARNRAGHHGDYLYEDPEWLRRSYYDKAMTMRQMAAEARCGLRTIARWMERYEIPTDRTRIGKGTPRGSESQQWRGGPAPCPQCGGPKAFYAAGCANCRDITREKNPKWNENPDDVTYEAMHSRVRAARGLPSAYSCAHCQGTPGQQWAYDHSDPNERRKSSRREGPFSLDIDKYLPLCTKCHRRFDVAWIKAKRSSTSRQVSPSMTSAAWTLNR